MSKGVRIAMGVLALAVVGGVSILAISMNEGQRS